MAEMVKTSDIDIFLSDAAWAVCSTYHTVLKAFSGTLHLLLTYSAHTHKARSSDLVYLVTWNPFTPLLGREWTYVAMVHSLSHQAMMQASYQLHTASFCSPQVSGNTHNTRDTRNVQSLSLLVHV
jgi:hypothetical protein